MRIASVASALPPHFYSQNELSAALEKLWGGKLFNPRRLAKLHRNVRVEGRHLALPLERYGELLTFGARNDAWIESAEALGAQAISAAAERAGIGLNAIDYLLFASSTGLATPSPDARLINRLGLRSDVRRLPLFGLGCVAGAAGIARAADLLRGAPQSVAVVLSVELCSLTLQRQDLSVANLIASGLFGDGAAAVVLGGDDRPHRGPEVRSTKSVFYPASEDVMGWHFSEHGFELVLSAKVPEMVRQHLGADVDRFLASQGLERKDIDRWIAHPGGPKVLEAIEEALELPSAALANSWQSLAQVGNLSSASVLLILERNLLEPPPPGSLGLLFALGPGFCSELVLLEW